MNSRFLVIKKKKTKQINKKKSLDSVKTEDV